MTREEIIALANDAELCQCIWIDESSEVIDSLVAFTKLVAAKAFPDGVDAEWIARRTKYAVEQEREACAKVCDDMDGSDWSPRQCAQAIRARSISRGEA